MSAENNDIKNGNFSSLRGAESDVAIQSDILWIASSATPSRNDKIDKLKQALIEGEESGIVEYDFEALLKEIDMAGI